MCGNQKRSISKPMARRIGRAISDFSMIQEKDRILVGVSGGKDSNLLLYSLCGLRARSPVRFEVLAATVDPLEGKSDLSSIQEFTRSLGVELLIVKYPLFDILGRSFTPSPCSLCANIRRGLLASTAQKNGCNVLALGHHRDDAVETVFLNLFFAGRFKCFHPNMTMDRSGIRVIRPLIYTAESDIRKESGSLGLPQVDFACTHSSGSQRAWVKGLLRKISPAAPNLSSNVIHGLRNLRPEEGWLPKPRGLEEDDREFD